MPSTMSGSAAATPKEAENGFPIGPGRRPCFVIGPAREVLCGSGRALHPAPAVAVGLEALEEALDPGAQLGRQILVVQGFLEFGDRRAFAALDFPQDRVAVVAGHDGL